MRKLFAGLVLLAAFSAWAKKPVTAQSWLVSDSHGKIIQSENIDQVRSIASITKLLTVITVLDARQDLEEQIQLSKKLRDRLPRKVTTLTRRQVIELAMVNSDNRAAQTLCEQYPGGFDACIAAMNRKLRDLSMGNSVVYEPTGLDARNVSTARELTYLVHAARNYGPVLEASQKTQVRIKIKKKWFFFHQTNPLVGKTQRVIVSKTGWITASGGCIALLMSTDLGDRIVIVMGSKNTHTRIPEAEFISNLRGPDDDQ
jgi:serine-type D-Ala-D-Ala endopeptidase (penicillin-binding protein 7)